MMLNLTPEQEAVEGLKFLRGPDRPKSDHRSDPAPNGLNQAWCQLRWRKATNRRANPAA
jgi:hypothetical protein